VTVEPQPSHCPACLRALPFDDGPEPLRSCPHCHHVLDATGSDLQTGAHTPSAKQRPGAKSCVRCRVDVAGDQYRQKLGDHYLCGDCADREMERAERTRALWPRIAAIVVVVAIFIASVVWMLFR
jgi:hypothetical protein